MHAKILEIRKRAHIFMNNNFLPHILRCYKKKLLIDEKLILEDVIVSLSTIPSRINKIWPTINSILLQTKLPKKIFLWLPYQYRRFDNVSITEIPSFLKNHPLIQVEFVENDWGPATKLLPCLQMFRHQPETKIIVIDDDRIYKPNLVEKLINFSDENPRAAVGRFGYFMCGKRKSYSTNKREKNIDVLCGFGGMLLKPGFFTKELFDYPKDLPEAFLDDDVWYSCHLKRKNVARILLPNRWWSFINCFIFHQNVLLSNWLPSSTALSKHDNKDFRKNLKVWAYFNQKHL